MKTFEGYVYLDHHYPPVLWNIVRGGFDSIGSLPDAEKGFAISVSLSSMLQNSSVSRLQAELSLERVRLATNPNSVSRLSGVFVFDDIESISRVWDSNKWGGHFADEYLADVGVWARKSTRVDAAWIEDIISNQGELLTDWEGAAVGYWSGQPKLKDTPIWEVLVEGRFCIWSMHSKKEALKEISAIWPNSLGLLKHSMNCFGLGSLDGQCFSGITGHDAGISVDHYLRMVDSKDSSFIERLARLSEEKPEFYTGKPDPEKMCLPDLTGYSKKICTKGDANLSALLGLLSQLNNSEGRGGSA